MPDSSDRGIFQARILERVAIPFFRGYSQCRDRIQVTCIADRIFTIWATNEVKIDTKDASDNLIQILPVYTTTLPILDRLNNIFIT